MTRHSQTECQYEPRVSGARVRRMGDSGMDREHGASDAVEYVIRLDLPPSRRAFDAAFEN